jgi:hypothetical protein
VSLAADGRPIAILTPARGDPAAEVGTTGNSCVALELLSIDPPRLARDCAGRAVARAQVAGSGLGACTHDARSATAIVATSKVSANRDWTIHASRVRP